MRIGLDLDGTVVSCAERHTALMRAAARQMHCRFDAQHFWSLKRDGNGNHDALRLLQIPPGTAASMSAIWASNIEALQWLAFDRPMVAPAQLQGIRRRTHSLHLITARANAVHARQQLQRLAILDAVDSLTVVSPLDPAPAKAMALRAHACDVYIGDSEVDQAACRLAGIGMRAVTSGMRSRAYLDSCGVTELWADLETCLGDWQ